MSRPGRARPWSRIMASEGSRGNVGVSRAVVLKAIKVDCCEGEGLFAPNRQKRAVVALEASPPSCCAAAQYSPLNTRHIWSVQEIQP
jgi:hypothetical protein